MSQQLADQGCQILQSIFLGFIFCRIKLIFGRLTCVDMKNIVRRDCSAHWSRGERLYPDHIPDVICSEEQQKKFESLLKKTPSKSLKKKVACVQRALVEAN